ncbi:MAG: VIT1/CCC1 transporter family protein [Cellvibrionaceae bacterium]
MIRLSRLTLQPSHTPEAIYQRLSSGPRQRYLKDMIYGAIDGSITTFAIVSGVSGAGLSTGVIIVLGLANLLADGFSMAASNFLGTRAENAYRESMREREEAEIDAYPEGEIEEVRQIFALKGFEGQALEDLVAAITANRKVWVDTMMHEEHGLNPEDSNAWWSAGATFIAFLAAGFLPLLTFVVNFFMPDMIESPFLISTGLTFLAFVLVGLAKGHFTRGSYFISAVETLVVGAVAAGLAYVVGYGLQSLVE